MRTVLAIVLLAAVLAPMCAGAQMPSVGSLPTSLIPDKAALLEQGKKIVADLLTLKENPKLPAADRGKVDALLPKANAVNAELAKPQVETSKLSQLAGQVTELQKQVAAIKATVVR